MSCMKKRILALLLVAVMFVLSACSSGGNDVSRAYNDAMNAMKQGKYAEAADKLSGISYYEDSVQLAQYCRAHAKAAEGLYGEAVDLLRKLGGYRDSSRCVDYFRAREAEDLASTPSERAYAASLYADDSISGFRDSPVRAETIRSALYQEGLKAEEAEGKRCQILLCFRQGVRSGRRRRRHEICERSEVLPQCPELS